jgi:hypothetical protein
LRVRRTLAVVDGLDVVVHEQREMLIASLEGTLAAKAVDRLLEDCAYPFAAKEFVDVRVGRRGNAGQLEFGGGKVHWDERDRAAALQPVRIAARLSDDAVDARAKKGAKARAPGVVSLERGVVERLDEEILREVFGVLA